MLNKYYYLLVILISFNNISQGVEVNDVTTTSLPKVNQASSNGLSTVDNSSFIDLNQHQLPSVEPGLKSDFESNSNSSESAAIAPVSDQQDSSQNNVPMPPLPTVISQKINLLTPANIAPLQVSNTNKISSKAVNKSTAPAISSATSVTPLIHTMVPVQNLPKLPTLASESALSKESTSLFDQASKTIDKLLADPTSEEYKAKKAATKAKLINEQKRRILIGSNIIKRYHKKNNIIINGYTSDIALIKAHDALINNNISSLRIMLDNYPILNRKDHKGDNLLQIAIKTGNYQLTQYLLIKGANIFAKDFDKKSVLAIASDNDDQNIIKLLYRAGAR